MRYVKKSVLLFLITVQASLVFAGGLTCSEVLSSIKSNTDPSSVVYILKDIFPNFASGRLSELDLATAKWIDNKLVDLSTSEKVKAIEALSTIQVLTNQELSQFTSGVSILAGFRADENKIIMHRSLVDHPISRVQLVHEFDHVVFMLKNRKPSTRKLELSAYTTQYDFFAEVLEEGIFDYESYRSETIARRKEILNNKETLSGGFLFVGDRFLGILPAALQPDEVTLGINAFADQILMLQIDLTQKGKRTFFKYFSTSSYWKNILMENTTSLVFGGCFALFYLAQAVF